MVWLDHRNGASSIDLDGPVDTHKLMELHLTSQLEGLVAFGKVGTGLL